MTPEERKIEAAAYALFRFDAARHPVKQTSEAAKWAVWTRVRPLYVKRAELALQAASEGIKGRGLPVKPAGAHRQGENLELPVPEMSFDL